MARGTPLKCIRVSDELWTRFDQAAKINGTTRTELLRAYIQSYVAAQRDQPGKDRQT